ncbi:MAG: hypothetical protein RJB38_1033 [Pseudomonadota bacterium]|jgi:hypothetical protein
MRYSGVFLVAIVAAIVAAALGTFSTTGFGAEPPSAMRAELRFELKFNESTSEVPAGFPSFLLVDLNQPGFELHESYWRLFEQAQEAGLTLDSQVLMNRVCFRGDPHQVVARVAQLSDGYLPEQFTVIRLKHVDRREIRLIYSLNDEQSDRHLWVLPTCDRSNLSGN